MRFHFHTTLKRLLADTFTPVGIYLKLRDVFAESILLESSDYHGSENAFTYICCVPIANFEVQGQKLRVQYPDGTQHQQEIRQTGEALDALQDFAAAFVPDETGHKFITNGLFGYIAYDGVQYVEELRLTDKPGIQIPEVLYRVYQYIIAINHFNEEVYIIENQVEGLASDSKVPLIESLLNSRSLAGYRFALDGQETSNLSDEEFLAIIEKGKHHCRIGDVFQIVLSRRFERAFKGDDFNVYRALRSINPSPYLFYFDYGAFRIFGSSPEAQIVIRDGQAIIYPIAGTFRRTGNDVQDAQIAQDLFNDPKENAEHIMLVDLARNDLSRHCDQVKVETFKEIQYFSHVIHLVSKVTGKVQSEALLPVVGDTFPAGTLSGAPKYKAMQLIDRFEPTRRSYYGGCIGFMGFDGSFNHAIMIRSFLSKNGVLTYQAGAGVVAKSVAQNELEEVHNKLRALRTALQVACDI